MKTDRLCLVLCALWFRTPTASAQVPERCGTPPRVLMPGAFEAAAPSDCGYFSTDTNGDLICDTNPQSTATFGCPSSKSTCGSPDSIHNYRDYTDDPCTWEFTTEQVNRMRCTIGHWRPDLPVPHPRVRPR